MAGGPVRSTMLDLIQRTRDRIGDADIAGKPQVFTDYQVQVALDESRTDILLSTYYELAGNYVVSGATQLWTDYFDAYGHGDWESDALLYNGGFTQLAPTTSDYLVGHWTFVAGQVPPVYVVGKWYDLWFASGLLWTRRAALQNDSFDVNLHRNTMARSQKFDHCMKMANACFALAQPRTAKLVRRDTHGTFAY